MLLSYSTLFTADTSRRDLLWKSTTCCRIVSTCAGVSVSFCGSLQSFATSSSCSSGALAVSHVSLL